MKGKVFLLFSGVSLLIAALFGFSTHYERKPFVMPESNKHFLLLTNYDTEDTTSTLAQLLCIEGEKLGDSIEERMRAAKLCLDSVATPDEYYITHDGVWHQYAGKAHYLIVEWCKDGFYETCKFFK